jgi:hypothetical protein
MRSRHSQKSGQKTRETSPAQAVQIALDRRDNGGDAAAPHASAASTHAADPNAASAHATPPTASLTRQ